MPESILVNKGNKLHNALLNVVSVISVLYAIINYFIGNFFDFYIVIGLIVSVTICQILNKLKFILASKLLNLFSVIAVITFISLNSGPETLEVVFFIPTVVGTMIVFQGKERYYGIVLALFTLLIYLFLIVTDLRIGYYRFSPEKLELERILNLAGAGIITLLEIYYILNLSNRIQEDLIGVSKLQKSVNEELKQSILLRDKITSTISHDVRGPVAMISAGLDMFNFDERFSDDEKMIVSELRKSADATVDLIDNLMLWSSSLKYNPVPISASEIRRMISDFKSLYKIKNIEVVMHLAEPESVMADKTLLQSILRNLYSNAVKFTPSGGTIVISMQAVKHGIMFNVKDSGIGMSEAQKFKLMSGGTFTRRGTDKEVGHGIGLQLVRDFLKIHKSELLIESEEGKGSVFYFVMKSAREY